MLETGAIAPTFIGTSAEGTPLNFADYQGRPVVLYFYPKANTTGCTAEAKGFAEHFPELQRAGYSIVGVSVDSVASQKSFSEKCKLPFPLVADHDRSIAKQYGVVGLLGMAKRVTFLIGADGRVQEVVQGILPGPHVARALERARASEPSTSP